MKGRPGTRHFRGGAGAGPNQKLRYHSKGLAGINRSTQLSTEIRNGPQG
jgi:hypothetical protein